MHAYGLISMSFIFGIILLLLGSIFLLFGIFRYKPDETGPDGPGRVVAVIVGVALLLLGALTAMA